VEELTQWGFARAGADGQRGAQLAVRGRWSGAGGLNESNRIVAAG